MAKDKKTKQQEEDPVATALVTPDAPVEATAPVVPAGGPPERVANGRRPQAATAPPSGGIADTVGSVASDVARTVNRVLPNRAPAYLGVAALVVLGVIDLPAAAGGALAYEAVRRWGPGSGR